MNLKENSNMNDTELIKTDHMFIERKDNISSYQVRVQDMEIILEMFDTLKNLIAYRKDLEKPTEVDNYLDRLERCVKKLDQPDNYRLRWKENFVFLPELKIPNKPNNIAEELEINSNDTSCVKIEDLDFEKLIKIFATFETSIKISNLVWEDFVQHQNFDEFIKREKENFVIQFNQDTSNAILMLEQYLHAMNILFPYKEIYDARKFCDDLLKWLRGEVNPK